MARRLVMLDDEAPVACAGGHSWVDAGGDFEICAVCETQQWHLHEAPPRSFVGDVDDRMDVDVEPYPDSSLY